MKLASFTCACVALCALSPVVLSGCGDDDVAAATDAGVDASTGGDAGAGGDAGGTGIDAGGLDAAASDAGGGAADAGTRDAGPPCPATAPANGTACAVSDQVCGYLDCGSGGAGAVTATCGSTGWATSTMACNAVTCGATTCASGEVCVERASGAFIQTCEASPCGTGPIEESCACTLCGALGCTVSGFLVHCVSDCPMCP